MINLEKVFCLLKAILLAMKKDIFKWHQFCVIYFLYLVFCFKTKSFYYNSMWRLNPLLNKICILAGLMIFSIHSFAQLNPEGVYQPNIKTVRFHSYGNQETMPLYNLNSDEKLELHFDDLDGDVKNYYYTFQLCDYNWQPVNMSPFAYIKGFTQQRINTYRYSTLAYTRYTHYQATIPENNSRPIISGNYLLKVFLDGDTTKLAFTRTLLVLEPKCIVSAQVVQPFTPNTFRTHQRLRFTVNAQGLNSFNPNRDIKVVVMQNFRWDNAKMNIPPTFIRGNSLEFNTEDQFVFPGGKEWRWLDLRSFSLLSERVDSADKHKNSTDIYVRPDIDRNIQKYYYYGDLNGMYLTTTYESINPYWQGDYATVHFSFLPQSQNPYPGKDVYMIGQLTDYKLSDENKLVFNDEKGMYECSKYLKQGYYSYGYMLVDRNDPSQQTDLDGNYWETENTYTILVYYKSFSDQADKLIGVSKIDTRTDRPGFSF